MNKLSENRNRLVQKKNGALKRKLIILRQDIPETAYKALDTSYSFTKGTNAIPFTGEVSEKKINFYIVGSGRSGNTLFRRLSMENYYVYIPPEIPGVGKCIREFTKYRRGVGNCLMDKKYISIGANTYIQSGTIYSGNASVKIGRNCAIDHYVMIKARTHNPANPTRSNSNDNHERLEKDIIIGANGVVTKNISSNEIVGGCPTKFIRNL